MAYYIISSIKIVFVNHRKSMKDRQYNVQKKKNKRTQ
jgi:hypothetical protein